MGQDPIIVVNVVVKIKIISLLAYQKYPEVSIVIRTIRLEEMASHQQDQGWAILWLGYVLNTCWYSDHLKSSERLTGDQPIWKDWPAVQLPPDNWVARKNFWQMGLRYPTICLGIKTFSDQISAELAPNVLRGQIISCAVQICSRARQGPEIWMQGGKKRKVANGLRIRKRYAELSSSLCRWVKLGNLWLESWRCSLAT